MAGSGKDKSMGRNPRLSDEQVAARLAGEMGVLAFRRLADGGMTVVNGRGQKQTYGADDVRACAQEG
jgi:hypothetical protein